MKSFTFGGINSRDYGVGISGTGTYDAPERDVDIIDIPGRSGSIIQDNGRFRNIQVTYPAWMHRDFDEWFSRFKAVMQQFVGYQRLEDEYDTEHYREAMFSGPIQPRTGIYNKSGKFDVVFNCKPQRFLKSGAEAVTYMPLTATSTGSQVSGIEVSPGTEFAFRATYQEGSIGDIVITYSAAGGTTIRTDTTPISGQSVAYTGTVPTGAATVSVEFPPGENDYVTIVNNGQAMHYNDTGIVLVNPTAYDARPVLTFYGASNTTIPLLNVGEATTYDIVIDEVSFPAVTIDSVLSDAYFKGYVGYIYVVENLNLAVTLTQGGSIAYDYPVLKGGSVVVIPTQGFEKAVITPGWWEV